MKHTVIPRKISRARDLWEVEAFLEVAGIVEVAVISGR